MKISFAQFILSSWTSSRRTSLKTEVLLSRNPIDRSAGMLVARFISSATSSSVVKRTMWPVCSVYPLQLDNVKHKPETAVGEGEDQAGRRPVHLYVPSPRWVPLVKA